MPAYNAERYVSEAIESVLCQTFRNFELLIVNDGSTDDTLSTVESYARRDDRVTVVSQASNMGIVAALNRGLELIGTEWVVRMDADEVMLSERIERQVKFVEENPDLAVAATGSYFIDGSGKTIGKHLPPLTSRARVEEMVRRDELIAFHHSAVIMRRSVVSKVGGYRQEFSLVEDLDLWNRIADHGHAILVQPEYLVKVRKHDRSTSHATQARQTWLKVGWLEACTSNRRSRRPEPSWEEFSTDWRSATWWTRLHRERKVMARVLYNTAVVHFSACRYHLCAPALLGAILLKPSLLSNRTPALLSAMLATPPFSLANRKLGSMRAGKR
jgi:glycosyltransferase involved in cell wall biosynthesis